MSQRACDQDSERIARWARFGATEQHGYAARLHDRIRLAYVVAGSESRGVGMRLRCPA